MVYATVYMVIENTDAFDAYREKAGAALAKHGGQVAAAQPGPTVLDGGLPTPSVAAVLSFPSKEAALAWREDPDLDDVHALRNASGPCAIFLVA